MYGAVFSTGAAGGCCVTLDLSDQNDDELDESYLFAYFFDSCYDKENQILFVSTVVPSADYTAL